MAVEPTALTDETCGTFALGGEFPVRRMGFGAMRLTGKGIWGTLDDPERARSVLRRAVELGVNLIDTADAYGPDVNERAIAEALRPYASDLVIATKGGFVRTGPDQWTPNGRPEHLRAACNGSLERLGVDRIALYQLHTVDPDVPLAESVGALAQLQAEGKVAHIGLSNVTLEQLREAQAVATIAGVQNPYNLANRSGDDVLRACADDNIAFLPYYPLDRGRIAGPALDDIAAAHGTTPRAVALAWLLQRSPVMLPIPGTGSPAHLEENVSAAAIELDAAQIERLDGFSPELSRRSQVFPKQLSPERLERVRAGAGVFRRLWSRLTGR